MLRLQDNNVIYNNSEELCSIEDMNFIESGFSIILSDGSMVFIPEQDCTQSEREVFQSYHEYYKDTGGVKPQELLPLDVVKSAKIQEINTACTNAILTGFEVTKDGSTHLLGFDEQDQANLTQQMAIIGITPEPITWKVKSELQFLEFTRDEFLQIGLIAKQHKWDKMQKYYQLCTQVQACMTNEEVEAIRW